VQVRAPVVPVDVLTVDDSPGFLDAARELIAATPGFRAVGEASSGKDGLAAAARLHPDLVLLDARMPDMDGIQAARRLCAASPDVVVVLVSVDDLDDLPDAARNCGAAAFVRKDRLNPRTLRRLWARGHAATGG
jgi:two-component system invasion response regulator UvrY